MRHFGREEDMDVLVERCAGLDVHRDSVVATVRLPGARRRRREQHTRAFATTIAQLDALADRLAGFGVTLLGMEAHQSCFAFSAFQASVKLSAQVTSSSGIAATPQRPGASSCFDSKLRVR
jgi:hypothetical protein